MTAPEEGGAPDDFHIVLHGVPEEEREKILSAVKVHSVFFRGPLPPPTMLKIYNEAFPGCAERVVALVEKSQQKRFRMELLREVFPFVMALVALIAGAGLVVLDKDVLGGIILGSLLGCAALYIRSTFRARRNSGNGKQ